MSACFCSGPQNGEPLCPCAMSARNVFKRDGHWIQPEIDLGEINEEECLKEEIGTGRYGCRCQNCSEGIITEAEYREEK